MAQHVTRTPRQHRSLLAVFWRVPTSRSESSRYHSAVRALPFHHRILALVAIACGLQGCATHAELGWQDDLQQAIRDQSKLFDSANFPAEFRTDQSLAAQRDGLHAGDELLYGICLHVGDTRKTWYLKIQVLDLLEKRQPHGRSCPAFEVRVRPGKAQLAERRKSSLAIWAALKSGEAELATETKARIRVTAIDANGKILSTAESEESSTFLTNGLLPACKSGFAQRDVMRGRVALGRSAPILELDRKAFADVQAAACGVAACQSFFRTLRSNPATKDILYEVIALPSLWSVITNLGVNVSFEADFFAAERVRQGQLSNANRELWSVPCNLQLNGQPALLARIVAGPSGSPDAAAAGIFAIVGQHPSSPDRRLNVQLLGSRHVPPTADR
jgi:hypothetical protein